MSVVGGPDIVNDGLVLCLDAANKKSYPGTGTTWYDLSRYKNHGTLTNGPTFDNNNGGSIVFDGTNDVVNFGNIGENLYNFNCWFYLNQTVTSTSTTRGFFKYGDILQSGLNFGSVTFLVVNETLTILNENPSNTYQRTSMTENILSGWNHISINWNGSKYDMSINNILKTTTNGNVVDVPLINLTNLILGNGFSTSFYFLGKISYVSIYNRSLSASEIQQNYNVTKGRYGL